MKTSRNVKKTPLWQNWKAQGAFFRDVSGWECPDWFEPKYPDVEATVEPLGWGKPHWFENWA